jgi:hypothetical protein
MGYTTAFEGESHCYCPENEQIGAFLRAIREGDAAAVAPLADYLIDHGDSRGKGIARNIQRNYKGLKWLWRMFGLKWPHAHYLRAFSRTRRMRRDPEKASRLPDQAREHAGLPIGEEGGYFVGGLGFGGQAVDESVIDANAPPKGQPGLWCQWTVPDKYTAAIIWDGGEKFYNYLQWLEYLLAHFLGPWGYIVNGEVAWQGESKTDRGTIMVVENVVKAVPRG